MILSKIMPMKIWKNGNYYQTKRVTFLEQWIEVNMDKIVITIFQGSVVTQTMLGGLYICIIQLQISYSVLCAKNMKIDWE